MADGGLATLRVEEFLGRLASGDPTPGGGSASALAGALGASLVSMVCNLTLGRERYASFEVDARALQAEADALRMRLQRGIDEDAAAYDGVMATYRLPRGSDEEKAARSAAIQKATQAAALVPLALAEAGATVIDLAERALGKTNPNAASDLAVAALLGVAALDGAAANVEINLVSLKDEPAKAEIADRLAKARNGRREQAARVVAQTHG
ncbi:MAG TPA: cyclodeaminase/cyclohydrolase family protein [Chloroflexota bacterium]|nr:cyclodeaminase/cyclohydrolase family protein [Chloroflexota bacterium]